MLFIVAKRHGGIGRTKGNGWKATIPDGKKHSYTVRAMNKGSGGRSKAYYKVSHTKWGSFDRYGNMINDKRRTHVNQSRKSYKQIKHILRGRR